MAPNNEATIKLRQVLTRCRCQIQSATWQTTGFCTQTSTNLWMTREMNRTQQDDINNIEKKCSTSEHTDPGISHSAASLFSPGQILHFMMRSCLTGWQNIVPLQDARRRQVVDDVLEANMFEHWTEGGALLGVQEGFFLTQVCRAKFSTSESE